ncbi:MAG: hypothetical protein U0470_03740 [Anaerolineae bacterium]
MARRLDPTHIIATIERLRQRIDERFPGSGLGSLAGDLLALAREAAAVSDQLRRPMWSIRAGALIVVVLAGALMVAAARSLPAPLRFDSLLDVLQAIEAGINDAIFLAVALFFLGTLEQRVKRRRALVIIHRLRSVAHIVDMHQLTKDPDRLRAGRSTTASSPRAPLSVEALGRYLDYCSELLSLTSKVAALFGEHRSDPSCSPRSTRSSSSRPDSRQRSGRRSRSSTPPRARRRRRRRRRHWPRRPRRLSPDAHPPNARMRPCRVRWPGQRPSPRRPPWSSPWPARPPAAAPQTMSRCRVRRSKARRSRAAPPSRPRRPSCSPTTPPAHQRRRRPPAPAPAVGMSIEWTRRSARRTGGASRSAGRSGA